METTSVNQVEEEQQGVPNPIMMTSSEPFDHSPITTEQTIDESSASNNTAVNLSHPLSPLASPTLTNDPQPPTGAHHRQTSMQSHGTSSSTMEAMASAIDGEGMPVDDSAGGSLGGLIEKDYEPPTNRRRRANTIHWATSQSSSDCPDKSESLQAVNFGDGQQQQQQQVVQFSVGMSGPGNTRRKQGLSSSFTCGQQTSAGLGNRTMSSNSLYSEYSENDSQSHSPGAMSTAQTTTTATATTYGSVSRSGAIPLSRPSSTGNMLDKRQKRLERNRESARASRKRRKQYLEELEIKVNRLSEEMDRGRMHHASIAVRTVRSMRLGKLRDVEQLGRAANVSGGSRLGIQHNVTSSSLPVSTNSATSLEQQIIPLTTNLSRTSDELQIVQTFMKQQLLSLIQPASSRFILWLSLQKDGFYRGGRSASERLSAGRIGERLLHSGTNHATPSTGMWPLTCHEIGLSYDQEERIRTTQRAILANPETWINRHTALATKNVVGSVHDVVGEAQVAAKRRETNFLDILTPEQRVKFMTWSSRKGDELRRLGENNLVGSVGRREGCGDEDYATSPDRHVAANLYIIDHLLSKVKQRQQQQRVLHTSAQATEQTTAPNSLINIHPTKLKKLSRRPSLETLHGLDDKHDSDCGNSKLSREKSFPSSGSLKRSLNDMTLSVDHVTRMVNSGSNSSLNSVSPESAQMAGQTAAMSVLQDVMKIVPKNAWYCPPPAQQPLDVPSQPHTQPPQARKPKSRAKKDNTKHIPPAQQLVASDDIDIPMPTPVSVLLQTSDDFISSEPMYEQQEPLDADLESYSTESLDFMPEQVTSHTNNTLGLGHRHQSAPQLYTSSLGGNISPTHEFSYPSLLPQAANMGTIPESSGVTNPMMMPPSPGDTAFGDFVMEELPEINTDDWAIGLDMDVDANQGAA